MIGLAWVVLTALAVTGFFATTWRRVERDRLRLLRHQEALRRARRDDHIARMERNLGWRP